MIRFLFRFLATVALAIAVIMAVLDATRTVAASALVMTPLGKSWASASPESLAAVRDLLETAIDPLLWDPIMVEILKLPGFGIFGLIALLLYMIGHKPRRGAERFAAARN